MAFADPGNVPSPKRDTTMKKIALIFALVFALTTGMAGVTVVAHMDQAMADGGGCGGGNC